MKLPDFIHLKEMKLGERERYQLFIGSVLLIFLIVLLGLRPLIPKASSDTERDPIFDRTVVVYQESPLQGETEKVVEYGYIGDKVSQKLAPNEDVSKRTMTSYTKVLQEPTRNSEGKYEAIIYAKETFAQEGNDWYYIEYATTTETAFNDRRAEQPLAGLFWKKAYAADIYTGAGDGDVLGYYSFSGSCSYPTYGCCFTGQSGFNSVDSGSANPTNTTLSVQASGFYFTDGFSIVCSGTRTRAFLPFVTSSIPAAATVSSAVLNLYATSKNNSVNDGFDYVTVVRTNQATHTTLADGDYFNSGTTEGIASGQRKDITSISTSAYLTFTLNATGISWIAKSGVASNCSATAGITCIGLKEGHDINESDPGSDPANSATFSSSEATGTSQDPYLTVTYSTGFAFWMWSDY